MNTDTYKTIKNKAEGYFKDKGSKFMAYAIPVQNEEEIKKILADIKKEHHSARHHCYAWRLGSEKITFRANDDGEPSSTAGKPILGQLRSYKITNTLIVVVRYFGGTLLGTSGLINAYRSAAADAITNATIIQKTIVKTYRLDFTYNEMGEVMTIIKQQNLKIDDTKFEENCSLHFSVRKSQAKNIEMVFKQVLGVKISGETN